MVGEQLGCLLHCALGAVAMKRHIWDSLSNTEVREYYENGIVARLTPR
jgi:hypothetical protein